MFLAIRDGKIVETSKDIESLLRLDPVTHEVVEWDGPLPPYDPTTGEPRLDPRTPIQQQADVNMRYKKHRLREYPSVRRQLDMLYWDAINGTTTWMDAITKIKNKYPKSP